MSAPTEARPSLRPAAAFGELPLPAGVEVLSVELPVGPLTVLRAAAAAHGHDVPRGTVLLVP
ncbi:hypothetical protein, partial [Mycetocola reblochoni]